MLRRVYEQGEVQIIERAGIPVVGIVPISDLQRLYPRTIQAQPSLVQSAQRERAARQLSALLDAVQAGNEK